MKQCQTCGNDLKDHPDHYADYCGIGCVPVRKNRTWKCIECGQIVIAREQPEGLSWQDGHTCTFEEVKECSE